MMLKDAELAQIRELLDVGDEEDLLLAMGDPGDLGDEDLLDGGTGDLFEISLRNPLVAGQVQELSTLWNGDISMTEEGILDDPELDNALAKARFNRTLLKDGPQETAADPRMVNLRERLLANGDVQALVVPPPSSVPYRERPMMTSFRLKDRLDGISGLVDLKGKDILDESLVPGSDARCPRLILVQDAEGWETPIDFSADDITF